MFARLASRAGPGGPAGAPSPAWIGASVAAWSASCYIAYELFRPEPKLPDCSQRCCTFNALAPGYDEDIEKDEKAAGILDMRRDVVSRARGHVLELGAGTGRNLRFYTGDVSGLLMGDYSEPMLRVAARKVAVARAEADAPPVASNVTLAVLDACALSLPSDRYDAVVDTFGLCSFERPEEALREMQRVAKPGGRILLLEHGKSDWRTLAWWQQHRLNRHVVKWGCFWNRDILELVEGSGLRIVDVQRRHMGTTYLIEC